MKTILINLKNHFLLLFALLLSIQLDAQDVQNSRLMSQSMEVTRVVGTTQIKVVYHSPTTQGRVIFGGIVPYDFVVDAKEYPWRAGSNNRTTIEFEHDVKIEGQDLKAGKYGLVVLVAKKHWTFIFSSNTSWGAFQYTPDNDVLRVKVEVEKRPHQEWLSYDFVDPKPESVGIGLRWEKVSAKFRVVTDVNSNILSELAKKENKTASDYRVMAIESMTKNSGQVDKALEYLEEGLTRINELEENRQPGERFSINMLKADYLILKGQTQKGKVLKEETIAKTQGFNMYYYGLNTLIVKGDKKEAFRLLSENIKSNPKQWQGYLAMGEYYLKDNNQSEVVKNFKKAYELAPENWKNYAHYLYLQNKLVLEKK